MLKGQRDSTSGAQVSIWTRSAETPKFPVVGEDLKADVCVVGAGMAGLSVAYGLVLEGLNVVVVDDGAIGSGETGRTSAHLASAVDDHFQIIEKDHGPEVARVVAESHAAAISRIESIAAAEGIECAFKRVDGFLFTPPGEGWDFLQAEAEAARRAGLIAHRVKRAPIPSFDTGPALKFPAQAQFHPLRYLAGLAEAIVRRGGRIFSGTHAAAIEGGGEARIALKNGHVITAGSVVVATNVPVNDRFVMHTKLEPNRTYVVAAEAPLGLLPDALLWDTEDPYHFIRAVRGQGHDLLLVGGEDHETGMAHDFETRYARLEAWMRERYPEAGPIVDRWSGQIIETVDGLAYIGRNPLDADNVYIVTGDSGNGLTHGAIAGILIPDLIQGRENAWEEAYKPSRVKVKAAGEFNRHNLKVAAHYADWLKGGSAEGEDEIAPGAGAVLRHGLKPMAVYKEPDGTVHRLSAVCPHLKCVVNWNDSEKTWDCPCHGSRFDCRGHVVNGPANRDLTHLESAQPALHGPHEAES